MQPSAQADEFKNIMKRLPLTAESLDSRGLYVYDDGFRFVVWFGRMLSPDLAMNLLGQDAAAEFSKVCTVSILF
jgi:protein transport protein SEC24